MIDSPKRLETPHGDATISPSRKDVLNDNLCGDAPASDSRNLIDLYKGMVEEDIRRALDLKRCEAVCLCLNHTNDFNKAQIIRAANAFLFKAVYLIGKQKYDRRGAVGTYHYEHVLHAFDESIILDLIGEGYTIFAVENVEQYEPQSLTQVALPAKSGFLFGEEMAGIAPELFKLCNGGAIKIDKLGSVRSLNVAQAASICMYEYRRQHP